eukprot:403343695
MRLIYTEKGNQVLRDLQKDQQTQKQQKKEKKYQKQNSYSSQTLIVHETDSNYEEQSHYRSSSIDNQTQNQSKESRQRYKGPGALNTIFEQSFEQSMMSQSRTGFGSLALQSRFNATNLIPNSKSQLQLHSTNNINYQEFQQSIVDQSPDILQIPNHLKQQQQNTYNSVNNSNSNSLLPNIVNSETQRAIQQCDFLFQIEVKKPKIKISHKFKQVYEKLQNNQIKIQNKQSLQNNAWLRFGNAPMNQANFQTTDVTHKSSALQNYINHGQENPQSQHTIKTIMNRNGLSRSQDHHNKDQNIVGSLRIEMNNQDEEFINQKQQSNLKILNYPSVTKDILSQRILPERMSSLPDLLNKNMLNIKKLNHKSSTKKLTPLSHNPSMSKLEIFNSRSKKDQPLIQDQKHLEIWDEIQQNKLGKSLVRQSEKEKTRLTLVKKIVDQSERHRKHIPQIQPVIDLKSEEKTEIERGIDSRERQRYLKRISKQKDQKYGKVWPKHYTGQQQQQQQLFIVNRGHKSVLKQQSSDNSFLNQTRITLNDSTNGSYQEFLSPIDRSKIRESRLNF